MLAKVFYACCSIFPSYGKEKDQMMDSLQIFNMCLYGFSMEQIEGAFMAWMRRSKQFPTPADIINLIERGNKPAFDKVVYLSISKKRAEERTSEEWEYMREYEQWSITGEF